MAHWSGNFQTGAISFASPSRHSPYQIHDQLISSPASSSPSCSTSSTSCPSPCRLLGGGDRRPPSSSSRWWPRWRPRWPRTPRPPPSPPRRWERTRRCHLSVYTQFSLKGMAYKGCFLGLGYFLEKLRDGWGRFACTNSGVIANIYSMKISNIRLGCGTRDEIS